MSRSANDNAASSDAPIKLTRAQLRELVRIRERAQELVEAAAQLEKDIVTKDTREYLVRTAKPSPEMVAMVTQRLRKKGIIP